MRNDDQMIEFIRRTHHREFPEAVIQKAKWVLLDTLGVGLAGARSLACEKIHRLMADFPMDPQEAVVWGRSERTSCLWAALANGMAASCLDADDGHRGAKGHPAGVMVPATLAAAERVGASGRQCLEALIVGYEIGARVGMFVNRRQKAVFYGAGTWTSLGAAAAAARLLGLEKAECRSALGIAEIHTPLALIMGWIELRKAPEVKEGMAWSALTGLAAALLAERGMAGTFSLPLQPEGAVILSGLDSDFEILKSYFKLYPSCRWTHPVIHAVLQAVAANRLKHGDIDRIRIGLHEKACHLDDVRPEFSERAQYSIPFLVGAALVYGRIGPAEVTAPCLSNPDVLNIAQKVEISADPALEAAYPEKTMARVEIQTLGGKTILMEPRDWTPGDYQRPLTDRELRDKFEIYAGTMLPREKVRRLEEAVMSVDQMPRIVELTRELMTG